MAESAQNSMGNPSSEVEQLLAGIQDLDEVHRKDFVARLMEEILHAPAKKVAIDEAINSAADDVKQDLVIQAVSSADGLQAKKAAAAQAVEKAQNGEEPEVIAEAVKRVSTLEGKKTAAAQAVEKAQNGEEPEVVAEAVKKVSTLEGKKTAAAEAFKTTPDLRDKQEIFASIRNETEDLRKMIGNMILWSFVVVAVIASLTLIVSIFGRLSSVQTLVIIATALASTLAGYCLGAASLIGQRLRDFARRETEQRE